MRLIYKKLVILIYFTSLKVEIIHWGNFYLCYLGVPFFGMTVEHNLVGIYFLLKNHIYQSLNIIYK
jgi:hypothetical protein